MDVSGNIRRESTARSSIVIMLFVCLDNPINLYGCAASRCAIVRFLDMSKVKGWIERSRAKIHNQLIIVRPL